VQWWRVVGAIGRFMMRAGVLVLLFVAYQLWGTGLATNRAQDRLQSEFASQLADASTTTSDPSTTSTTTSPVTTPPVTAPADLPAPEPGDAVAHIEIPAIGVDFIVLQGVDLKWLKEGPGHVPQTPLPGQPGNVALAGHRTTYAAPFNRLDELQPGDDITFETVQGTFTYKVDAHETVPGEPPSGHFVVKPSQVEILDQDGTNKVTLMACNPKYSARERIVVTGTLVSNPAAPTPLPEVTDSKGNAVTIDASVDALAGGDSSAKLPAVFWTALALLIWFLTWLAARRWPIWHKVPVYAVGTPIFLVVLFVAYENLARLLPASF
jgi:sortase A